MKSNFYTISIEEAITPFIKQVESLVDLRKVNSFRRLSQYSLCKACEAVNLAVLGFISTAENIASHYPSISSEILNSCNWSRSLIAKILDSTLNYNNETDPKHSSLNKINVSNEPKGANFHSLDNRGLKTQHSNATFIQFSEGLMKSIERILLLADWIIVLDIRRNIIKVIQSLNDIDSKGTENFPAFMHMFSRFGADMVELGEVSGQRQLDLKSTQHRCLVALTRSMLERTTMMILAVWKVNFRHDTRTSRTLRALVFQHTNYLLDLMMGFLVVSHPLYGELSRHFMNESKNNFDDVGFLEKQSQTLYEKIFSDQIFIWEILNNLKKLVVSNPVNNDDSTSPKDSVSKIDLALPLINELMSCGQLFTQCFFVSLPERQQIISLCRRLRVQLRSCFESSKEDNSIESEERENQARMFVEDLCNQIVTALFKITINYCDEVIGAAMRVSNEIELQQSHCIKNSSDNGKPPKSGVVMNSSSNKLKQVDNNSNLSDIKPDSIALTEFDSVDFGVTKIKVITICKFLAHLSMSREISLVCNLTEEFIEKIAHMIDLTIKIFTEISISKHARDCADVLFDVWISIISDVANIKNDISDWRSHKYSTQYYKFNSRATNSSDIMKKYKMFHSPNVLELITQANSVFSVPISPSVALTTKANNQNKFIFDKPLKNNFINPIYSTFSLNSLIQENSIMTADSMNKKGHESPNPWLSVTEIEKIISMKGQVVIDFASQITMFSHNEGPLKTSIDLMNATNQMVRELANFHAFAERNLLSDHILSELDRFPALISMICSIQSQNPASRSNLLIKIDKIVELARYSATLVTTVITNWKNQSTNCELINVNQFSNNHHNYLRPGPSSTPMNVFKHFHFDDIPDNKSCFSDTTNNFLLQKPRITLTRSSSMGRKLDCDPFN